MSRPVQDNLEGDRGLSGGQFREMQIEKLRKELAEAEEVIAYPWSERRKVQRAWAAKARIKQELKDYGAEP